LKNTLYEKHDLSQPNYASILQTMVHGYMDPETRDVLGLKPNTQATDNYNVDVYNFDLGYGFPNGGLISTVDDMETFVRALFTKDGYPSGVDKKAFLESLLPAKGVAYGLGVGTDKAGCYGHN